MLMVKHDDSAKIRSGMAWVNVALGLPIVRSSVDYGTAFENAGKKAAEPGSLLHAVE